jgi:hypothetical protein
MSVNLSMSPAYMAQYEGVSFGLTLISGCQTSVNPPGFDQYKRKLLRKIRKRETLAQISEQVDTYDQFFKGFGFECPDRSDGRLLWAIVATEPSPRDQAQVGSSAACSGWIPPLKCMLSLRNKNILILRNPAPGILCVKCG